MKKSDLLIIKAFKNANDEYCHLHIDELDSACVNLHSYFRKGVYYYLKSLKILNDSHFSKKCILCFPLESDFVLQGPNFRSLSELEKQFTLEPPLLYFLKDLNSLKNTPMQRIESSELQMLVKPDMGFYYSEYKDSSDEEYRRLLWVVSNSVARELSESGGGANEGRSRSV